MESFVTALSFGVGSGFFLYVLFSLIGYGIYESLKLLKGG